MYYTYSKQVQLNHHHCLLDVHALIMYQYLAHLAGITVKLRRANIDSAEAYEIEEVASFYRIETEDCDKTLSHIYIQSGWALIPECL